MTATNVRRARTTATVVSRRRAPRRPVRSRTRRPIASRPPSRFARRSRPGRGGRLRGSRPAASRAARSRARRRAGRERREPREARERRAPREAHRQPREARRQAARTARLSGPMAAGMSEPMRGPMAAGMSEPMTRPKAAGMSEPMTGPMAAGMSRRSREILGTRRIRSLRPPGEIRRETGLPRHRGPPAQSGSRARLPRNRLVSSDASHLRARASPGVLPIGWPAVDRRHRIPDHPLVRAQPCLIWSWPRSSAAG